MYITIKKKEGSNQWDYPLEIKKFGAGFKNPDNLKELIVEYKGDMTIGQLNSKVNYTIREYAKKAETVRGPERRQVADRRT